MSNMYDAVGGARLFNGSNYSFTEDRFGKLNSAIAFNKGFLKVSPVFEGDFKGDFTITAWIYMQSYQLTNTYTNLIDFGEGMDSNNIVFGPVNNYIRFAVHAAHNQKILDVKSDKDLAFFINIKQWYHVASIFYNGMSQHGVAYIYINGTLVCSGPVSKPRNVNRTSNFIAGNNWNVSSDAIYDDIKIYKSVLSPAEIQLDMSIGSNNST